MASFDLAPNNSVGSFLGQLGGLPVIDSTYSLLGGTYGAINYVYGGFAITFGTTTPNSLATFTPGAALPATGTFVPL